MEYIEFCYTYDYKYRLLLCLLNNYYINKLADNKIKSFVVIAASSQNKLMKDYDIIFKIIKELKVEDLDTLRKFISRRNRKILELFEENNYTDENIIDELKKDYSIENSSYMKNYDDENHFDKNIKMVFVENDKLRHIYDKHLVRDIFLTEAYDRRMYEYGTKTNYIFGAIVEYVTRYKEVKNIVKDVTGINLQEDKNYRLNLYMQSDSESINYLEDEIYNLRIFD